MGRGYCAFGADPRRGYLRPLWHCFLSSIFNRDFMEPKVEGGSSEECAWPHTKKGLFFRATTVVHLATL